jgi:peptidoglycan-associated lipoprotein
MKEGTSLQKGVDDMKTLQATICLVLALGVGTLGISGCAKKAVLSGGDTQSSQQGTAKGSEGTTEGGVSQEFPDTSLSGREGSSGLRGLDKSPSEEQVGNGGSTLMAKADPGKADRQMEEIRAEQSAAALAGLRDVFFAYDSFAISEEGRQALSHNADWMKSNPSARLKIEGHCDERGTSAYNLVLGEKRAKAVRNYLVELGVAANDLSMVSYGKERPFCKERAESCYAKNRRGHIVLKTGK